MTRAQTYRMVWIRCGGGGEEEEEYVSKCSFVEGNEALPDKR